MTDQADIVERLESALAHFVASEVEGMTSYTSEMLREAAAEITRLRAALAERTEECARVAEDFGRPYALKSATGAMMFRAVTDKIAAAIRARGR